MGSPIVRRLSIFLARVKDHMESKKDTEENSAALTLNVGTSCLLINSKVGVLYAIEEGSREKDYPPLD